VITHRPSVINRADWIVFLENGQLQQQGSLEELRSLSGSHTDFLING
jgi:ATP-binding cassette subfamily C protein